MWSLASLLVVVFYSTSVQSNPSSENCTWQYVNQPLSHFQRSEGGVFKQRLCVYSSYWEPNKGLPVFLYTGNESPVDEYVNATGLMWDLAEKMNALIVFAEHRYFGESIPPINGVDNCISYLTSEEALADYAALCNEMRRTWGVEDGAIIAFGGSYGGMLSSWLRTVYPTAIDGAIAASAPVWGFPSEDCPLDGSAATVSYAVSSEAGAAPLCASNLKAAYVLISDAAKSEEGRALLSEAMDLCTPLESQQDVTSFLSYLQSPLFNMAEGSYPFPSSYITFALTGTDAKLPAWPLQVMCDTIASDYGIVTAGDTSSVSFSVSMGDIEVKVDWDTTTSSYSPSELQSSDVLRLASDVARSIQLWYNVTGTLASCIDWSTAAPNSPIDSYTKAAHKSSHSTRGGLRNPRAHTMMAHPSVEGVEQRSSKDASSSAAAASSAESSSSAAAAADSPQPLITASKTCTAEDKVVDPLTAWNILTCNDGINLVNWWAQGVGNDVYWPPNQKKGYSKASLVPGSMAYCAYLGAMGLYGVPRKLDEWSKWLDTVYGGTRIQQAASNIVYTNGNLDPWMAAGVLKVTSSPSIESIVIDMGGHHLDLFWPTRDDPVSVKYAREVEEASIRRWIDEKKGAK